MVKNARLKRLVAGFSFANRIIKDVNLKKMVYIFRKRTILNFYAKVFPELSPAKPSKLFKCANIEYFNITY
jgi:hypothetical protein